MKNVYPDDATIDVSLQYDSKLSQHGADDQRGRELLKATRPFVEISAGRSWWHVGLIFFLVVAALTGAGLAGWWPLRTALALLGCLLMVRTFITYHDYMHGAILRDSKIAKILFHVYGAFTLTPARSWKMGHNHHHGHVGQLTTETIGAFPIITARMWRKSSRGQRASYRAKRHPLIVLFGYITIFAFSITLLPLLRNPLKHWDSALSLLAHGGLIALLAVFGGFDNVFFVILLPMTIASVFGSYLFFAQHSFKDMRILPPESWTFYRGALLSSSYLRLGRIMEWFTGNIGYHHVHHLNVRIPFYRLPEAMAAIPALQSPIFTSLSPREIVNCFRSSLWDEQLERMVSYREAGRAK